MIEFTFITSSFTYLMQTQNIYSHQNILKAKIKNKTCFEIFCVKTLFECTVCVSPPKHIVLESSETFLVKFLGTKKVSFCHLRLCVDI